MEFRYNLNDKPPALTSFFLGLQWLAISIPSFIITGSVVCGIYGIPYEGLILYIQKLLFVSGAAIILQVFFGHRLPLVTGPATILLIGVIAAHGKDPALIYTSVATGGVMILLLSVSGLFGYIRKLFTPVVVSVVLILIVFTLLPTILKMITSAPGKFRIMGAFFSLVFLLIMLLLNHFLKGFFKTTLIIWGMAVAGVIYYNIFPCEVLLSDGISFFGTFTKEPLLIPEFDGGVIVSFIFCFLALTVNDLGSIQSLNNLIYPGNMKGRIKRGTFISGIINIFSGFLGVLGQVNYSLSPGVITLSGCASRYALIPAAMIMIVLSFTPGLIAFISLVPQVVVGTILFFIMCSQFSAGLMVLFENMENFNFNMAFTAATSVMMGTIVSFFPPEFIKLLPDFLQPVLGNGFVPGILTAIFLDHLVFKK